MNQVLHHLRRTRWLAALLLAWLVLFVGAAAAAPLMKAGPTEVLCSASGIVKGIGVTSGGQGGEAQAKTQHSIDCVLCCFTADVPVIPVAWAPPAQPLGHVLQSIPAARIAAITAAPLPPRGPPHLS
jgi:hypothetical protein